MKNLFTYLAKKGKRRKAFSQSEEFHFFIENRHSLLSLQPFINFYDVENDPFLIMRANIILKAHFNKNKIEEMVNNISKDIDDKIDHNAFVKAFNERIIDLPFYQLDDTKIYIPFFSPSLNTVYINEPEKLLSNPYDALKNDFIDTLIDPFDTYGSELFNSSFSKLVKIKSVNKETAFFHHATNTIYFVNEQGRLDSKIVLFDTYLRHPNYENILERIKPVVDAYFAFDREGLINNLFINGFISSRLLHRIKFHDWAKV